jgi:hypothetical protein
MPFPTDVASNYGYYARLMIALAVIAYADPMASIPGQVEPLGQQVVWGPAELVDGLGVSYSRAYITRRDSMDEYTLVIRGTNALSLQSWTLQDFDVGRAVPFNTLAPHAPPNALISQGTYNGMADLLSLKDSTGRTLVEYLRDVRPGRLYVTGHSLGGTLTPPMFALLNDTLYGGVYVENMAPFSFAGLSPGNAAFNTYFNGLFDPQLRWRFHNTLDIAPSMWASLSDIRNIYRSHRLFWDFLERDWLSLKFREGRRFGYEQPAGGWALEGQFDSTIVDDHLWAAQAAHQHHGPTYQMLVNAAFPDSGSTSIHFRQIRQPATQTAGR